MLCQRKRDGWTKKEKKEREKGMRVRRRKCEESIAKTAAERDHAFIQSSMSFFGTLKTLFAFFFFLLEAF